MALVAKFTTNISQIQCATGVRVNFIDASTGDPDGWLWDFGDGIKSTGDPAQNKNPGHTYAKSGTYKVCLTVRKNTIASLPGCFMVSAQRIQIKSSFTTGRAPGLYSIQFTDTTGSDPTSIQPASWDWDFGDGTKSTEQNPIHDFRGKGTFNVKLTAHSPGCVDVPSTQTVVVKEVVMVPAFSYAPMGDVVGGKKIIKFTDYSTGFPTGWSWTFGDGGSSTEQNPSHSFVIGRMYAVKLVISRNGFTSQNMSQTINVTGSIVPVVAKWDIDWSPDTPHVISFNDKSTGSPISWLWAFNDGTSSIEQHPNHEYATAGTYQVTLTVSKTGTPDSSLSGSIVVKDIVVTPVSAAFSVMIEQANPRPIAHFTDQSTGNPTSWYWTFGDGGTSTDRDPTWTYTVNGTYDVQLKVSKAGTPDSYSEITQIRVTGTQPALFADFTLAVVPGSTNEIQFTDLSLGLPDNYLWIFGDGSSSTEQNPIHRYTIYGVYSPSLHISRVGGVEASKECFDCVHYHDPGPANEYVLIFDKPSLASNETKYFNGGAIFPAGTYTVTMVSGWWYYDSNRGGIGSYDWVKAELGMFWPTFEGDVGGRPVGSPLTLNITLPSPSPIWIYQGDRAIHSDNGTYPGYEPTVMLKGPI